MKKFLLLSFLCMVFVMFTNTAKAQDPNCCFFLEQVPELHPNQIMPDIPGAEFGLNPITSDNIGKAEYYYFRFVNCLEPKAKLSIDWEFTVNGEAWNKPLNATYSNPRNRINVEFEWAFPLITGSVHPGVPVFQGSGPLLSGMGLNTPVVNPADEFMMVNGVKRAVKTDFPGQIDNSPYGNGALFGYFNPYTGTPRWYNYIYADFLQWACENNYLRIKITRYSTDEVDATFKLIQRVDGFEFKDHYIGTQQTDYMGGHDAVYWRQVGECEFITPEYSEREIVVCSGTEVTYGIGLDGLPTFVEQEDATFPDDVVITRYVPFYNQDALCDNNIDSVVLLTVIWKPLPEFDFVSEPEAENGLVEFCFTEEEMEVVFTLTAYPEDGDFTYFIQADHRRPVRENTFTLTITEPGRHRVTGWVVQHINENLSCASATRETIRVIANELPVFDTTDVRNRESCLLDDVAHNGSVTLVSEDPYLFTYSKNGGARVESVGPATEYTFDNLLEGTYTFYAINEETECENEITVTIEQVIENPIRAVSVEEEYIPILCYGDSATIVIIAEGGVAPYQGEGTFKKPAGTYKFPVTDARGCTDTATVVVEAAPELLVAFVALDSIIKCHGGTTTVTVSATGGTEEYEGTGTFTVSAGTHTFTVIDANGCQADTTITVGQPDAALAAFVALDSVIKCYGGTTTVTVSATGGTTPYVGTGTFTVSDGKYAYIVTDARGCTAKTDSIRVIQPTQLTATARITDSIACYGGTATVAISFSGGTPPYTYNGGAVTSPHSISGVAPGTYSYTIRDSRQCAATTPTITVTQPDTLKITGVTYTEMLNCYGDSTLVTVTATGGTGAKTYYLFGETAAEVEVEIINTTGIFKVPAGSYTAYVADTKECVDAWYNIVIDEPEAIVIVNITVAEPMLDCYGDVTTITVEAENGVPFISEGNEENEEDEYYIFTLLNEAREVVATTETGEFTNVPAGTYTIYATDANGCNSAESESFTIDQPTPVTGTSNSAFAPCNYETATITVVGAGGTPGYTYYLAGTTTPNTTGVFLNMPEGIHTFIIVDAHGCTATVKDTVVAPAPLNATYQITTPVRCKGGNAAVRILATGGVPGYTYYLMDGSIATLNPTRDFTLAGAPSPGRVHYIKVEDTDGCDTIIPVTVIDDLTQVEITSVTWPPILCNGNTTTVTVTATGGTPPYSYNFGGRINTNGVFTPISAGNYTVTVTDANNCSTTRRDTVRQPDVLIITNVTWSPDPLLCNGDLTTVTVTTTGGTGTKTYSLGSRSNTTGVFTNVAAGAYTVSVVDANGCSDTWTGGIDIPEPTVLTITSVTWSPDPLLCNGDLTTVTITATGGTGTKTYHLGSRSNTTGVFTDVAAGAYTVSVVDANGCSDTWTGGINIPQPDALVFTRADIEISEILCHGQLATITVITADLGGTLPYTFTLAPGTNTTGQTSGIFTGVPAGVYTLRVTDDNGCWDTINNVTVTQPNTPLSVTITGDTIRCIATDVPPTLTATPVGGTPGYTYVWNPGAIPGNPLTNVDAGTYTVTVTDSKGCTATSAPHTVGYYDNVDITITAEKSCIDSVITVTIVCAAPIATISINGYDAYGNPNTPIAITEKTKVVTGNTAIFEVVYRGTTTDYIYFIATVTFDAPAPPCTYYSDPSNIINYRNFPELLVYKNSEHTAAYDPMENYITDAVVNQRVNHYFRVDDLCGYDDDLRLSVGYKYYYQAPGATEREPAIPIGNFLIPGATMTYSTPMNIVGFDCGTPGWAISYNFTSGDAYFPREAPGGWTIGTIQYGFFRLKFLKDREITVSISGFAQPGTYTIEYELVTRRLAGGGQVGATMGQSCPDIGQFGGNGWSPALYTEIVLSRRTMTIEVTGTVPPPAPETLIGKPEATIYPNPTTDNISIKFENVEGEAQVRVMNMNGQVLVNQQINIADSDVNITLPELNPGVYFVNIISEKAVITRKLVITK